MSCEPIAILQRPITEEILQLFAEGLSKEDIAQTLKLDYEWVCRQIEITVDEKYQDPDEDKRRINAKFHILDKLLLQKIAKKPSTRLMMTLIKSLESQAKLRGRNAPIKTESKVTRTLTTEKEYQDVCIALGLTPPKSLPSVESNELPRESESSPQVRETEDVQPPGELREDQRLAGR